MKQLLLALMLLLPLRSEAFLHGSGLNALGTPTGITLSNASFLSNQNNPTVGNITVAASGGTFICGVNGATCAFATAPQTGCLSGSDANNASFAQTGTVLSVSGTLIPSTSQGSYKVCISATGNATTVYQSFTLSGIETPGPSAAWWNSPIYTCSTNYYIATAGGGGSDSNNGTSAGTPWLTLQHAESTVAGGTGGVCFNVAAGTYAVGVNISKGGSTSSATGFRVWRCSAIPQPVGTALTSANACLMTDNGSGTGKSGPFPISGAAGPKYVIIDGFAMNPTSAAYNGQGIDVDNGNVATYTFSAHHIFAFNNVIWGQGQSGIQMNAGDYFWIIHNTIYNSSGSSSACGNEGSNISLYEPIAAVGYSPTAFDTVNGMVGNIAAVGIMGLPTNMVVEWNLLYNASLSASCGFATDGNGLIYDSSLSNQFNTTTVQGGGQTSGATSLTVASAASFPSSGNFTVLIGTEQEQVTAGQGTTTWTVTRGYNNTAAAAHSTGATVQPGPYYGGLLAAFNVTYNNGGGGMHVFESSYATIANNSTYNQYLDTTDTGTWRGAMDAAGSYGGTYINNISVSIPSTGSCGGGSPYTQFNNAVLTSPPSTITTTVGVGGITSGATSLPVTAATGFLGAGNFVIVIGSEEMLVTAGQGTTTWTVTRGYQGTTAASHSAASTITWVTNYFSTNVTQLQGGNSSCAGEIEVNNGSGSGDIYPSSQNKENTSPGWVAVGNVSVGTRFAPPSGANFSLSGGAAPIGYGATPAYLSWQAMDAGACSSLVPGGSTCP